jgi:hypothetical protein
MVCQQEIWHSPMVSNVVRSYGSSGPICRHARAWNTIGRRRRAWQTSTTRARAYVFVVVVAVKTGVIKLGYPSEEL